MTLAVPQTSPVAADDASVEESLKRFPMKYRATLRKVRGLEAHLTALSDKSLKQYINKIRAAVRDAGGGIGSARKSAQAQTLDKNLPAVFACVCVAAKRTLNMRPYNVQLI